VYQVVGLLPQQAARAGVGGRTRTPLLGRAHALATLQIALAQVEGGRGQVVGIIGEPGMARRPGSARQALDLARQQKMRGDEALALHQLGVVQAHADPPDALQAKAYYQQALTLADALGMRPLQAHCQLGLGMLYVQIGRSKPACAQLSAAITLYRAMDMTFWLPQAEGALAQVVGTGGQ
jgi:hypothetical protein